MVVYKEVVLSSANFNMKGKKMTTNYAGSAMHTHNDTENRYGASKQYPVTVSEIKKIEPAKDMVFTVDEFRQNINNIRTVARVAYVQIKTKHHSDNDPSLTYSIRVPPIWKLKFEYNKTQYTYNDYQKYETPEQIGSATEAVATMLFAASKNGFIKVDENVFLFMSDIISPVLVSYAEEEIIPTDIVDIMAKDYKKIFALHVPGKYLKTCSKNETKEATQETLEESFDDQDVNINEAFFD